MGVCVIRKAKEGVYDRRTTNCKGINAHHSSFLNLIRLVKWDGYILKFDFLKQMVYGSRNDRDST